MYNIVKSSDKATIIRPEKVKYPFSELEVGQSFSAPFSKEERGRLNAACNYHNKKEPTKRFVVRSHRENGLLEVARVS